jgi:hypothetical protein
MTGVSVDWKDHLAMEYAKDQFACQLLDGQIQDDNFKVMNDLIYCKDCIFLVPESAFKAKHAGVPHQIRPNPSNPFHYGTRRSF